MCGPVECVVNFNYDKPTVFTISQWQCSSAPSWFYVLYRWLTLVAVFAVGSIEMYSLNLRFFDGYCSPSSAFTYFMICWTCAFWSLQTSLGAILVTVRAIRNPTKECCPCIYKTYWMTSVVVNGNTFVTQALFWGIYYYNDMVREEQEEADAMLLISVGLGGVLVLVDLLVVAYPIRLLHGYAPMVFGLWALIVLHGISYFLLRPWLGNDDYYCPTGPYEKQLFDKRVKITIGLGFGSCIVNWIGHVLCWILHKLRLCIYRTFYKKCIEAESNGDDNAHTIIDL